MTSDAEGNAEVYRVCAVGGRSLGRVSGAAVHARWRAFNDKAAALNYAMCLARGRVAWHLLLRDGDDGVRAVDAGSNEAERSPPRGTESARGASRDFRVDFRTMNGAEAREPRAQKASATRPISSRAFTRVPARQAASSFAIRTDKRISDAAVIAQDPQARHSPCL